MDMDLSQKVESILVPQGFVLLPELSRDRDAYARSLSWEGRKISQRVFAPIRRENGVWAWITHPVIGYEPFRISFAARTPTGEIVKVGSERDVRVDSDHYAWYDRLWDVLDDFNLLREKDEPCRSCEGGRLRRDTERGLVEYFCFRCMGKGYVNWTDRMRNALYDKKHRGRVRR